MPKRNLSLALAWIAVVALAGSTVIVSGCAADQPAPRRQAAPADNGASAGAAAGGTRPAPGLYDMSDGTVQAVGTLERSELEGGYWKITGGTASEGNLGITVVVIANGDDLTDRLRALEGKVVMAIGKRQEGASTRSAGPEMAVDTVDEISDTGGPAN
jgi:hypothetical protein